MGRRVFHLGLFDLPVSHKKDARLIWVNHVSNFSQVFAFVNVEMGIVFSIIFIQHMAIKDK